jgi:hypothetical protein
MDNGYLHWKAITINCRCPTKFEPIIELLVLLMCGTRIRTHKENIILKQKLELKANWRLNKWLCFGFGRYELEPGLIFKTTNDFLFFLRIRFRFHLCLELKLEPRWF